jgi:hypothetical protein
VVLLVAAQRIRRSNEQRDKVPDFYISFDPSFIPPVIILHSPSSKPTLNYDTTKKASPGCLSGSHENTLPKPPPHHNISNKVSSPNPSIPLKHTTSAKMRTETKNQKSYIYIYINSAKKQISRPSSHSQRTRALKPPRRHTLHLHRSPLALKLILNRRRALSLPFTESLVTVFVFPLEVKIRRRSWTTEDYGPVLENIALSKRPMTVFLEEFTRIKVFARSVTATNKEEVIAHEGSRVGGSEDSIDNHSEGDAEVGDGGTEGDVLLVLVDDDLGEVGG